MKLQIISVFCVLSLSISLYAQDANRNITHSIAFKPQFSQYKDQFNYGLVSRGFNLNGSYTLTSSSKENIIAYQAEIGLGVNLSKGIGLAGSFKPLDVFYGFKMNTRKNVEIAIGPYLEAYYFWQLYPELQSGKMFWLSSYETGPRFVFSIPVKKRILEISSTNSLAGFNSRPMAETERYFYSLAFSDFVKNPHSKMSFRFANVFNHNALCLNWINPARNLSFAYEIEYFGYKAAPALEIYCHSLKLNWKINNKKNK